jgi:hypothetical protein
VGPDVIYGTRALRNLFIYHPFVTRVILGQVNQSIRIEREIHKHITRITKVPVNTTYKNHCPTQKCYHLSE